MSYCISLSRKRLTCTRSLVYVIDDLLNLAKIEDVHIVPPPGSFGFTNVIIEVVETFRKESVRKNLALTVSTHPGLPERVRGDPSRLRQVLLNVTSNAFQHSEEGYVHSSDS